MDEYIEEVKMFGITEEKFEEETKARLTEVMTDMHKIGNVAKGWNRDMVHKALYNALKAFKGEI